MEKSNREPVQMKACLGILFFALASLAPARDMPRDTDLVQGIDVECFLHRWNVSVGENGVDVMQQGLRFWLFDRDGKRAGRLVAGVFGDVARAAHPLRGALRLPSRGDRRFIVSRQAKGRNPNVSTFAYESIDYSSETWSTGREMAYGYDAANQLTEVEQAALPVPPAMPALPPEKCGKLPVFCAAVGLTSR